MTALVAPLQIFADASLIYFTEQSQRLWFDANADLADRFDADLVDVDHDLFVAEGSAGFDGFQHRLLIIRRFQRRSSSETAVEK